MRVSYARTSVIAVASTVKAARGRTARHARYPRAPATRSTATERGGQRRRSPPTPQPSDHERERRIRGQEITVPLVRHQGHDDDVREGPGAEKPELPARW